jgi:hypothetical protein
MRHKLVVLMVLISMGMGVSATAVGATTPPSGLTCGQVITTSVVLHTDLNCAGDALVIGASGITVSLGHHHITSTDGAGLGVRFGEPDAAPPGCVSDVTVTGGTISGFLGGVGGGGCSSSTGDQVSGSTLTDNTWGVYSGAGFPLCLSHVTIDGPNGIGPNAGPGGESGQFSIDHTHITVTSTAGYSAFLSAGVRGTIDSSRLDGGLVLNADAPLTISDSRVTGSTFRCGDTGVTITTSHLIDSPVSGEACGFSFDGDHFDGPGSGTGIATGASNFSISLTNSVLSGWDTALLVGAPATITSDTFRQNGTGVSATSLFPTEPGTASGNRFVDNSGTGLLLTSGTWHVGSNTALRNGGLGIDAEGATLTVTDDGHNVARHNLPPQCVGVVCRR